MKKRRENTSQAVYCFKLRSMDCNLAMPFEERQDITKNRYYLVIIPIALGFKLYPYNCEINSMLYNMASLKNFIV